MPYRRVAVLQRLANNNKRKKREGFLFSGLGTKHKFPLSVRLNGPVFHTRDHLLLAITFLMSMWLSSGHCLPPKSIPWWQWPERREAPCLLRGWAPTGPQVTAQEGSGRGRCAFHRKCCISGLISSTSPPPRPLRLLCRTVLSLLRSLYREVQGE